MSDEIQPFDIAADQNVRVGCDLVALTEIAESISQFGDRYLGRVFTDRELAECSGVDHVARLAARYAGKEAVVKAFSETGLATPFHEVEISRPTGIPEVTLSGSLARKASQQKWISTRLSLSHTDCHAMAVVVVTCAAPGPPGGDISSR